MQSETQTPSVPPPAPTATQPAGGRWLNPWVAVAVIVGLYFAASFVAGILLTIYPGLKHWSSDQAQHWLSNNTHVQFLYALLAYALMVTPLVWILKSRGISLRRVGVKKPRWRDLGYGVLAFPVYFVVYGIVAAVVSQLVPGFNVNQQQQIGFGNATGTTDLVFTFISLAVIPPLAEEFMMRGFLFTNLRARLRLVAAVIITSIVFAAGHLQIGSGAPLLWVAALDTFTLSLFLIYLRVKTDSLWASICLHALKNSIAFVYLFILHKG